jgi:hypothetical protein
MSGVSGRVSVPQRRDAQEANYEPPDRSLWPLALVGVTRSAGAKHTLSDRCNLLRQKNRIYDLSDKILCANLGTEVVAYVVAIGH